MSTESQGIFEPTTEFPDPQAKKRYDRLVGLDHIKARLLKEARILLNPELLDSWSKRHHQIRIALVEKYKERSPLFIFGGDVGTGKTELAETFGDQIARQEDISVTLYSLSLSARGTGAVGEMTKLLSMAFAEVAQAAQKLVAKKGKPRGAVILLIDEADALAQSRELAQMHHEDRAGVNALIRGVSGFANGQLPALAVMCTNRLEALDPGVRRRAADTFKFDRPNDAQRAFMLQTALSDVGITEDQIQALARTIGPNGESSYGFTYSDIAQRLLPEILLDAFPERQIAFERVLEIAKTLKPTPPFESDRGESPAA
jgi:AAA+ superfamily predicted ATPase